MPWNIFGHEWAISQLEQNIRNQSLAHAYLFTGVAGLGKSLIALRLAQAINCETQRGEPCLTCRACKRIERGNHPDVRISGMASQTAGLKEEEAARQKELKISTIREWQRDIDFRPYEAQRRVLILHDAERLNEESSNAMLKTLEEPPPYALIILVANSADLLPTIVSRCRVLRLRPLARRAVSAALQRKGLTPSDAETIAAWSGGKIGWALRVAEQPSELQQRHEQIAALLELHEQSPGQAFQWAEQRAKEYRSGEQASVFGWLELWQTWWRDLLLIASGAPEAIIHIDRRDELELSARRLNLTQIYHFSARLSQAAVQLRENANPQLVLENLVLHLPKK